MEFLVSEVPLQNQLFLVFWNFKVMNNKFLIMSVCKHMETLQLGFFSYEFRSSENICGRHLLFVGLSLFGLCLFFGDSGCWLNCHCVWFFLCWLTATDWTCKSMCILYQKKHKKSPNSLLYKTNQTTEQRSCYSKVDTVIKYNFCLVNVRFQWNPAAVQPVCILREELLLVPVSDIRELNVLSSVLLRMSSLCRAAI